jgi:hypothetical protein
VDVATAHFATPALGNCLVHHLSGFSLKGFFMAIFRGFGASLLVLAAAVWLPIRPLAAQSVSQGNPGVDRYLRLDDGLYELNADGTYHKVKASSAASAPPPSTSQPRPATSSSSGRYTGQEQFMRFDDGLYERMADGTYTKVDERRQMQQQSQSGRYGASSSSMDPGWQQQYGRQEQWNNSRPQQWSNNGRPQQWSNGGSQQWSNNGRPQQWSNGGSQQWSNNGRPQQWNNGGSQQWNNSNQEDLRQLGQFLNALGGAIQNGNGNRPPRPSFQPQPSFQANQNFQPQVQPQPQPQAQPQRPPQPQRPAVDPLLQQGGNQSGFNLGGPGEQ